MASLNQVTLLGNCTRDPELRYLASGQALCNLGLAVTHRYGTGDQKQEETCFIDIIAFGRTGEVASEYLKKGSQILVTGRLQFRTWEGQDGMKRSKHTVVAEHIQFLTPRGMGQESNPPGTTPSTGKTAVATAQRQGARSAVKETGARVADIVPIEEDDIDIPF